VVDKVRDKVEELFAIIDMRLIDGVERNEIFVSHSPYKTRADLANRNAEHYRSLVDQVRELRAVINGREGK